MTSLQKKKLVADAIKADGVYVTAHKIGVQHATLQRWLLGARVYAKTEIALSKWADRKSGKASVAKPAKKTAIAKKATKKAPAKKVAKKTAIKKAPAKKAAKKAAPPKAVAKKRVRKSRPSGRVSSPVAEVQPAAVE